MRNDRAAFLARLRRALASERYAVLKRPEGSVEELPDRSDLDLAADRAAADRVRRLLREDPAVARFRWIDEPHATTARVFFRDGGFLQIDLVYAFLRRTLLYLDAGRVLDSARRDADGWKIAGPVASFEYVFLFHALNGAALPDRYRRRFARLDAADRAAILERFSAAYGWAARRLEDLFEPGEQTLDRIRRAIRRRPANGPFRRLIRALRRAAWLLAPGRRAPVVSVSGPDGSGKSTVLDRVEAVLSDRYRLRVARLRHRPGMLPILSAWILGRDEAERRAAARPPRRGSNRSMLSSLARFLYYLLDYWIGQAIVHLRYTARGVVVLYDRYFFDFIADPERSNLRLPAAWVRFVRPTVTEPDVNILLHASPAAVRARKDELAEDEIRDLTDRYVRLFADLAGGRARGRYAMVENDSLDAAVERVANLILAEV
ncbi:MAG TPA: hypothetical protein VNO22_16835 [Planctomycetota bacterium]|nr:hypothetical protein [Planctomycetota bacterium]